MSQKIVFSAPTETEKVCTTCKHFMEHEETFFCRFFEAFLSPETFCIPCDFQEKIVDSVVLHQKDEFPVLPESVTV